MLPGEISGGQYGAVGVQHSHVVTGVVHAGSYIVAVLCFRLRLVVFHYSSDGWLQERPQLPAEGGELDHISCGDVSPEFAAVPMRFRTWHAQGTASVHKDG